MNSAQIEKNLNELAKNISEKEFIFDFLLAYGTPKATVKLLKDGRYNLSKQSGQVILKKKLFFQAVKDKDLHETIDDLQKEKMTMRHEPRFIIVSDHKTILAVDTKTNDQLDIEIQDIAKHYDFFLPWAGIEKHRHKNENPADRKAAEKMAKLYDGILAENEISTEKRRHDLNVFLSRLLFCFFSEDTGIFEEKLFTNSVASHTQSDGSDLDSYLTTLFDALNSTDTSSYPKYIQKFPYVNGGLFKEKHWIPTFSAKSRRIIIECGELNWAEINPDIFGSMMQAVTHSGQRASLGMHYTSVPNIMKVIEPLFLDELKYEFEKQKGNLKKLNELRVRISKMKFFDPACGSGNFLIITYKELRKLEIDIIKEMGVFSFSDISLSQFYGIEIDDFAHEIAKLSLYLAEHQMNVVSKKYSFVSVKEPLPLKEGGNIKIGNATRIDWESVCPKEINNEIYVFGNPPYLGSRNQNKIQKEDMKEVFGKNYKSLDYISCWFYLGTKYIEGFSAKLAFVSTNSISQGEQVALLWPLLLSDNLEIFFAHQSFVWTNNAKKNAGVAVVVVGIRNIQKGIKKIFKNNIYTNVANINPYLTSSSSEYIRRRSIPLNKNLPKMLYGSLLNDGGNFILSAKEKDDLVLMFPSSKKFIRKYLGAKEFLRGEERWCLLISDKQLLEAMTIPPIKERLQKIKNLREESSEASTRKMAEFPHRYYFSAHKETNSIIIPQTGSERREYIPIGFLNSDTIVSNAARVIYDAEPWIFGLISSKIHIVWVRAVAGRLKNDMQYSNTLCYNTFPIPNLSSKQKEEINRHAYNILEEREKYSEKTMAQLYDPEKMPKGLREAHYLLDLAVERCYRSKPFLNDEERLETLFKLYEQMIKEEKSGNNKYFF